MDFVWWTRRVATWRQRSTATRRHFVASFRVLVYNIPGIVHVSVSYRIGWSEKSVITSVIILEEKMSRLTISVRIPITDCRLSITDKLSHMFARGKQGQLLLPLASPTATPRQPITDYRSRTGHSYSHSTQHSSTAWCRHAQRTIPWTSKRGEANSGAWRVWHLGCLHGECTHYGGHNNRWCRRSSRARIKPRAKWRGGGWPGWTGSGWTHDMCYDYDTFCFALFLSLDISFFFFSFLDIQERVYFVQSCFLASFCFSSS